MHSASDGFINLLLIKIAERISHVWSLLRVLRDQGVSMEDLISVLSLSQKEWLFLIYLLRDTRERLPYCMNASVFNRFMAQEHMILLNAAVLNRVVHNTELI